MQGQNNQSNINMNFVIVEYQEKVSNLANENVVMSAYIKQLEQQIKELEAKLAEKQEQEQ